MNRGDHREVIFRGDADRARFATILGEACAKTAWNVRALCRMPHVAQSTERLGAEHDGAERAATVEPTPKGSWRKHFNGGGGGKRKGASELKVTRRNGRWARLRAETAVTVKWIVGRLQMGSPGL